MNQRPQQPGDSRERSGNFQVNIDKRDLMTGPVEQPRARHQPDQYEEPYLSKKAQLTDKELRAEKRAHRKRNRVKARKNKRIFKIVWLCMVLLLSLIHI